MWKFFSNFYRAAGNKISAKELKKVNTIPVFKSEENIGDNYQLSNFSMLPKEKFKQFINTYNKENEEFTKNPAPYKKGVFCCGCWD